MEDKIQPYRQPIVTATGILLGFILNFASGWATKAFSTGNARAMIIGTGLCISTYSLVTVLFRVLNMNYPKDDAAAYYRKTLILFIIGISTVFLSIFVVIAESFIIHRL